MLLAKGKLTNAAGFIESPIIPNNREFVTVSVWGNFGTSANTVKLQDQGDRTDADEQPNSKWFDSGSDVAGTTDFRGNVRLAEGTFMKLVQSNPQADTDLHYIIRG